jgi:toxin ParE1/3/4
MIYRVSGRARRDPIEIWRYIDLITQRFRLVDENPYAGRSRDALRPGYRSFPVGQYVVFYHLSESGVQIMHVLHGKRDLDAQVES